MTAPPCSLPSLLGDPCDRAATAPLMVTATTAAIEEKDKADYLENSPDNTNCSTKPALAGPFGPDDFGQWSRARSSR